MKACVILLSLTFCLMTTPASAAMCNTASGAHRVIPLAFHVDYWNCLSRKDPFTQARIRNRTYCS